ncbi:hypothetical protein LNQ03_32930 [Klebsiella pneumoniae subsp. pneumoniae]|nr:hypothetical protein [Klebsiella pneumoniae subsp. pneumoniae]
MGIASDQVANHQAEWKEVLNHFFSDFTTQLATARKIRKRAACSRTRWCLPASTRRPAARKWGSVPPAPAFSSAVRAMPCRRKSGVQNHHQPGAGERGSPQRAGRR